MEHIVETKNGKVAGFEENRTLKWFGIPFAKPPVGELRFRRAQAVDSWVGVKDCTKMGCKPCQFAGGIFGKAFGTAHPASEDCLSLNIWAPLNAEKAPVFVWIYGGANHMGETSSPDYFLDSFPRDGIIGVSFNYRVGVFGFYDFSDLSDEFDSNCAPSDMAMALRWIHENIAFFGGDPDNITICGESAGGTAVYTMLATPSVQGCFKKAIAMSGLAGNVTGSRTQQLNRKDFLAALGLKESEINRLKTMPYEQIKLGTDCFFNGKASENPGILLTGPVVDDLVPMRPWEAMESGICKDVACMFGTCRDEGTLFYMGGLAPKSWAEVEKMLSLSGYGDRIDDFRRTYPGRDSRAIKALDRDRMFWADCMRCLLAQSAHNTVYNYRYDFTPVLGRLSGLGATHSMDVCPALDTWAGPMTMFYKGTPKKRVRKVHRELHGAFVNFVKYGEPGVAGWEPYDESRRATWVVDDECHMEYDLGREYFELWKDIDGLYM